MRWESHKRSMVSMSGVGAEFTGLWREGQQTTHLRYLVATIGRAPEKPTTSHQDDMAALGIVYSRCYSQPTKHLGLDIRAVGSLVSHATIKTKSVPTDARKRTC